MSTDAGFHSTSPPHTASLPPPAPILADRLPAGVEPASPWLRLGAYFLESFLAVVTLGIGWLIWGAMIGGGGQTPAKRLLGMRVIAADSLRPVGLGRMFWVRGFLANWIASLAIICTLGVLAFMPLWDRRNQNVWDKVSNTLVVTDPNDAWGMNVA